MKRPSNIFCFVLYIVVCTCTVVFVVTYDCCFSTSQHLPTNRIYSMANTTLCLTGKPCSYSDIVDFRVIVITFKRANSLWKLLHSLDTLVLDGDRAALEIWIDRNQKRSVDERTLKVSSLFTWKGGSTSVHVQVAK